jgi:hypothetical protein
MNTAISPITAPAPTITKTSTSSQEITPPAPPAGTKREPLTCEKRDETIAGLEKDGDTFVRFSGQMFRLLEILSSNCPTP